MSNIDEEILDENTISSQEMDLECLANELLLDLFEYLSSLDLLRAFYTLNTRLNDLIFLHFQRHALNFQSISKSHFQWICKQHLPTMTDAIIALRLSDDDDTPQQINLFFTYNFSFQQHFIYLQSLSIHRIYSSQSLHRIMLELPFLSHLRHLKITRYKIVYDELYDLQFLHRLGCLSQLLYCHLDITNDNHRCILIPTIRSSSVQVLSLPYLNCNLNQFQTLLADVVDLQSLYISIVDHSITSPTFTSINLLTITKLNMIFYGSLLSIKYLLQIMPNLEELKMNMPSTYIDGQQWEILIEKNLFRLKIIQLKMSISLPHEKHPEETIEEILNSFRRPFWIIKHRWFIQCHWTITDGSSIVSIYTLPYAFRHFSYSGNGQSKSTYSNENFHWSFDRIQNLYYGYIPSANISVPNIRLHNIRHLDLTIPFDDSFWTIVSTLDRLTSLNIVLNSQMDTKEIQWKLQILINRAICLHSLTYFSWSNENVFPFELRNFTIRQLDLRSPNLLYNYLQCIELTRSSIGQQCQVLLINVDQRANIIYLVNHMNNLRALIVQCPSTSSKSTNRNLLQWLEQHLPSTCLISNSAILDDDDDIRLWIG